MADLIRKSRMRSEKKIGRIRIGFNVLVQIVLVLFLVAMINSFAFKHYARWDFSRDQKYALSDKTKRFLDTLNGKMRVTVFFAPNTPITADVQNLLTEYQYAGKGKIDIEHIDPDRNLSRAKELFDKYKVVTDESLLVLDYDGRNKTVKASEMADIDQSGMAFGEGPRVAAFKGEQAITSAMIDLVEGKKKTLGYVTGHKEPPLSEGTSPISVLKTSIENGNIVQDNAITQDQQGLDFISGSVNWLLSREQLIGIAPKVSKPLTFSLNDEALRRLRWIVLVFIPLVPAVVGIMVWWQRRV